MTPVQLVPRSVAKVWGRRQPGFGFAQAASGDDPIGEIWFEEPNHRSGVLLVKYLFTSERLSVQVHPDDAGARALGHPRGKDECWMILKAEPGAQIGLGLKAVVAIDTLRLAALDGTIETMLDWREVSPGDVYYLPAGTIHAIGAGITLIEIQQNVDLTYRMYDYGRPRALHLEAALRVARPGPWQAPTQPYVLADARRIVAEGHKFVVEQWSGARAGTLAPGTAAWIVPLSGHGRIGTAPVEPGQTWLADEQHSLDYNGELLVAYPGSKVTEGLWVSSR